MPRAGTAQVSPGDHACCVFASDDDQATLVAKFARDAAARRDRILYLADTGDEGTIVDMVTDGGLDGRAMLDSGALQVMHSSQMGLEDGFERNRQLAAWRQLTGMARDDGYRGLAVTVEMTWAHTWGVDLDALIDYEATSDPVFVSRELSAVCQYDSRAFDGDTLRRACHAHRYAMEMDDDGLAVDYHRLLLHLGSELELGGEVDLANVHYLEQTLRELLAEGDMAADCSRLAFIDAGGCRALRVAADGGFGPGRLKLRNITEVVDRVMRVFEELEADR